MKEIGYEKSEGEIRSALNKFDMNMASKIQKEIEEKNWKDSLSNEISEPEFTSKIKLLDVILLNLQRKKIKYKRKRNFLENKENLKLSENHPRLSETSHFLNGTTNLKHLNAVKNQLEIQKKCHTSSKKVKCGSIV